MEATKSESRFASVHFQSINDDSQSGVKIIKRNDRILKKNGAFNFHFSNVKKQKRKYLNDLFTTMLEMKWRYLLTLYTLGFIGSWLFFAVGWYGTLYMHGDTLNFDKESWRPCVTGIQNFTSAFLFSIETQTTIGYGFFYITEECPIAVVIFCIQSVVGVLLETILVGLIFTKISRAKKRSKTLIFSNNAVISSRDGILHLMFQIADLRKSSLVEAHVRAQFIKKRTTREGEVINYHQQELKVGGDGEMDDKILLFLPTTIVHKITEDSPLFTLTQNNLHDDNNSFEIIVVLEGIVESTGLTTQARSSYLPSEILWGQRFECIASRKSHSGERILDYSLFNSTIPCDPDYFDC